jgi:hypothetical protein
VSKFYGTLTANFNGKESTRCGTLAMRAAAQSFHGSAIVEVFFRGEDLMVRIGYANGSDSHANEDVDMPFTKFVEHIKCLQTQEL